MLLDSNIIIYAAQTGNDRLRQFVVDNATSCSAISQVEVLGYHRLTSEDEQLLRQFFAALKVLSISDAVVERAIQLRRSRKRSLGDSIIAATALVHQLTLVTHNIDDFREIEGLRVIDPISAATP